MEWGGGERGYLVIAAQVAAAQADNGGAHLPWGDRGRGVGNGGAGFGGG